MDLTICQRNAITLFRNQAQEKSTESRKKINKLLLESGIISINKDDILNSIINKCRVAIHFQPDRFDKNRHLIIESIIESGIYKNQYETGVSNGHESAFYGGARDVWEKNLFSNIFHNKNIALSERPKYGALTIFDFPDGPSPGFGSCYFILKQNVSERCTFTYLDSHNNPEARGTINAFDSILESILSDIFKSGYCLGQSNLTILNFIDFIMHQKKGPQNMVNIEKPKRNLKHYIEVQIHGEISMYNDVEYFVIDKTFKNTEMENYINNLCEIYNIHPIWHSGYYMEQDNIPFEFQGYDLFNFYKSNYSKDIFNIIDIGNISRQIFLTNNSDKYTNLRKIRYLWHILLLYGKIIN